MQRYYDSGAAESRLQVHRLDNGLTVVLDDAPTFQNVLGIVVVKVGSKNDPQNLSGISHLLEHLLFNGTEKIGTSYYTGEKVYLDEIKRLQQLMKTNKAKDATIRNRLNHLHRKAAEFMIENEYVTLLDSIGSSHMRGYTGREATVFQNVFPATQIEKWLMLNSERFIRPVFRNFGSEIETVINEIAYYMDKPIAHVVDTFFSRFFKPHPCANSILGSEETVRNISVEDVEKHFSNFYKAGNMALILCGHINARSILPFIAETFGRLDGDVVQRVSADDSRTPNNVMPIGRQVVKMRLLPVRVGIMGYRTVCNGHQDHIALSVIEKMFRGTHACGILDQLIFQNKMVLGGVETVNYQDTGGFAIYYVPKRFKSFPSIEKQIWRELEKMKMGRLDARLLAGAKALLLKERQLSLERIEKRGKLLIDHLLSGNPWADFARFESCVNAIESPAVSAAAKRYFTDAYMAFYSGTAFAKTTKKIKPFKSCPLSAKPAKMSEFARRFNDIKARKPLEKYITFGENREDSALDVICTDIHSYAHLYCSRNPVNDIFSLKFRYGIGFAKAPQLLVLAKYHNVRKLGSETVLSSLFALQGMAGVYRIFCDRDYFEININGFEPDLTETITLVRRLFTSDKYDDAVIKSIYQKRKIDLKFEKHDPAALQKALTSYALHGEKALFLPGMSKKEMRTLTGSTLKGQQVRLLQNELDIFYAGNRKVQNLIEQLKNHFPLDRAHIKSESPSQPVVRQIEKDTIYLMHAPGVVNARILIVIEGGQNGPQDHCLSTIFNAYFKSIVFRTIRVEKSLAYSVGAHFTPSVSTNTKGRFVAFAEVRNRNALECIAVMAQLIEKMPVRHDLAAQATKAARNTILARTGIPFRRMPALVCDWKKKGFEADPGISAIKMLETMSFSHIKAFHTQSIRYKPKHIMVLANRRKINIRGLRRHAELQMVDRNSLFGS